MVSPGGVDLWVHGGDGQMFFFELTLLFDVGILELVVVILESNLDLVEADIEVAVSFFELSAPNGEVVFKSFLQFLTLFEVVPGVLGVDETAAMQGFHYLITIFLPSGSLVEIPREIQRQF